jgi:hypothetical protein
MADSSVAITAGSGTPIRVLTALGAGSADQQVVTPADSNGYFIGTSSTPAITSPGTLTTTTAVVLAANTARRGATVYVESGATLYLALGTTASLTAYTVQIAVGGYYEVPFGYTGALWGITSVGTAVVRVTELT